MSFKNFKPMNMHMYGYLMWTLDSI